MSPRHPYPHYLLSSKTSTFVFIRIGPFCGGEKTMYMWPHLPVPITPCLPAPPAPKPSSRVWPTLLNLSSISEDLLPDHPQNIQPRGLPESKGLLSLHKSPSQSLGRDRARQSGAASRSRPLSTSKSSLSPKWQDLTEHLELNDSEYASLGLCNTGPWKSGEAEGIAGQQR